MGNQNAKHAKKTATAADKGPAEENGSLISFQTYGEATTVPIQIRRAVFNVSNPAPFLRRYLASLELTVVNTVVPKNISGKLRVALPVGSTVKKFEVLRSDLPTPGWYPAVAVPKKKAKEVVYREVEKGRDVAAVSDVASGSNVFEIEVSPLPFGMEVKCRLECMLVGKVEDFGEMAASYFPDEETEVILATGGAAEGSPNEAKLGQDEALDVGGAVVGESFGKTHFVCRVPPVIHHSSGDGSEEVRRANAIERIAVVWDASSSMSKPASLLQKRCERLRELAIKCNENLDKPLVFELYTFGVGAAVKEGTFVNVNDLLSTIETIDCDGGTDMTELSALFTQFSQRQQDKSTEDGGIDSVLVFTDGMDNLGRLPQFDGLHSVPFPVHVVADSDKVNLRCVRAIASTSPQFPGSIFSQNDESYLTGVLYPQAILRSIKTDQSDDAFIQEVDDGFRCVPDHRLQYLNQVIGSEGLLISGVLGEEDVSTVSKIVAQVACGSEIYEYSFQLRGGPSIDGKIGKKAKKAHSQEDVHIHHYEAASILLAKETEQTSSKPVDPSRIPGYIYAEETYREAENFGFKSGMDINIVRETLSVQYGFCSPESSLLMLYEVEQFLENDVLPPEEHPAFNDERIIQERKKREQEKKSQSHDIKFKGGHTYAEGEIGGPKNEEQKKKVVLLAKDLERYFTTPVVSVKESQRQRRGMLHARAFSRESRFVPMSAQAQSAGMPTGLRRMRCSEQRMRCRMSGRSSRVECGGFERQGVSDDLALPSDDLALSSALMDDSADDFQDFASFSSPMMGYRSSMMSNRVGALDGSQTSVASNIRRDQSAVAPPKDPELYAKQLEESLKKESHGAWKKEYQAQREKMSGSGVPSPSFFLTCARLALKHNKTFDAIKIVTNCLEMEVEDVQMFRCVAYFLLSTKDEKGVGLAKQLLDQVQELQPCEPTSFLDSALVRFWELTSYKIDNHMADSEKQVIADIVVDAQNLIARVLTHRWASRFDEVEWPALILLHYVAAYVKELNEKLQIQSTKGALTEWPTPELSLYQSKAGKVLDWGTDPLRCSVFDIALMVWMGWDSDKTDVDLHVVEPTKNEVYYSNRTSSVGGRLSRDFTEGYGPEVYILRDRKEVTDLTLAGNYDIYAKYYASHQDSALTGTTSVLLWTIEKNKKSGGNNIEFLNVRLDTHKEKTKVKTVQLEGI